MKSLQSILLAMDSNEAAADAWVEALALAKRFGSTITLLHAISEGGESNPQFDVVAARVEELFEDLAGQAEREGVTVTRPFLIKPGKPSDLLMATAEELKVDLIMIGLGEKPTLERLFVGSTAERVMRRAKTPVWLVRPGRGHTTLERLLVAVDDSQPARAAMNAAVFLARSYTAELGLLTVVPSEGGGRKAVDPRRLENCVKEFDLHMLKVHSLVEEGEVNEGILRGAANDKCQLLVIGSEGRTGLARLWEPNTAERVARRVPCSLLIVKE